jgi:predicted nucleic acid-binding protein
VISDTGPLLHLNEINRLLLVLNWFDQLHLPEEVARELADYGLSVENVGTRKNLNIEL